MPTVVTTLPTQAQIENVSNDHRTTLGLPLPHPDNSAKNGDVWRLRAALIIADGLLADIPSQVADAMAVSVGSSPATLDTIRELAAALGDDPNKIATIMTSLGLKASTADLTAAVTTINTALALKASGASVTANTASIATNIIDIAGNTAAILALQNAAASARAHALMLAIAF